MNRSSHGSRTRTIHSSVHGGIDGRWDRARARWMVARGSCARRMHMDRACAPWMCIVRAPARARDLQLGATESACEIARLCAHPRARDLTEHQGSRPRARAHAPAVLPLGPRGIARTHAHAHAHVRCTWVVHARARCPCTCSLPRARSITSRARASSPETSHHLLSSFLPTFPGSSRRLSPNAFPFTNRFPTAVSPHEPLERKSEGGSSGRLRGWTWPGLGCRPSEPPPS